MQLGAFFNNSPKGLNIYLKTAHKMHNMETLPDNKHKNFVKKEKGQSMRDGLVCMHLLMEYTKNMSIY